MAREVLDQLGHGEDQVLRRGILDQLAVDPAAQLHVVPIRDLVEGDQRRSERPETGRGLAKAELRRLVRELEPPIRDVLTDAEAGHVLPGVRRPHPARLAADHHDLLDLPVDPIGSERNLGVFGPARQLGNFVKTIGCAGIGRPASSAWSR